MATSKAGEKVSGGDHGRWDEECTRNRQEDPSDLLRDRMENDR